MLLDAFALERSRYEPLIDSLRLEIRTCPHIVSYENSALANHGITTRLSRFDIVVPGNTEIYKPFSRSVLVIFVSTGVLRRRLLLSHAVGGVIRDSGSGPVASR